MPAEAGDSHEGNWYILVWGLPRPVGVLTLAPGVSLQALDEPLTVFDLAAAGAAGFREWAVLEPVAPACTVQIESARDSDVRPGYNALNRAWLALTLLGLRGFARQMGVACSGYSWNLIAGHQERTSSVFHRQTAEEGVEAAVYQSRRDLPPFRGNLLDFQIRLLTTADTRTDAVTDDDAAWVHKHFSTANKMAAESEGFRLALEAAIDWRFAKDPRSALARLWCGIESVFGISSELVYRVALLSASLLEPRGVERKRRFEEVKRLYAIRSKAVHGEGLAEDRLTQGMQDSYRLLRSLVLLCIERGHPLGQDDFDEAVLY